MKNDFICHYGIEGQKWGVRCYQNEDGTLTEEGKIRYGRLLDREKARINDEHEKIQRAEKENDDIRAGKSISKERVSIFQRLMQKNIDKTAMELNDREIENAKKEIDRILENSKDLQIRRKEIDSQLRENRDYLKHPEWQDDEEYTLLIKRETDELEKDLNEIDKKIKNEKEESRKAQSMLDKKTAQLTKNVNLFDNKKSTDSIRC